MSPHHPEKVQRFVTIQGVVPALPYKSATEMYRNNPFKLKAPFVPSSIPEGDGPAIIFLFHKDRLVTLLKKSEQVELLPELPVPLKEATSFFQCFGTYDGRPCFVAELPATKTLPTDLVSSSLRSLAGRLQPDHFTLAGRGLQILHWHNEHRFCGRCGSGTEQRENELAKYCLSCDFVSYPTISPAVIMAVTRGPEILLGRAERFPGRMYSTLAGFVEAGETLEEAVAREVCEETTIGVKNIRYIASQPWPFPHSLMIGFTAEYESGEIEIDRVELEDARWFHKDRLPEIPSKITIARMLIDTVIKEMK